VKSAHRENGGHEEGQVRFDDTLELKTKLVVALEAHFRMGSGRRSMNLLLATAQCQRV
jgi:hypothetical protein